MTAVSKAGAWSVNEGIVITLEGATKVTVISDGSTDFVTAEDPVQLIAALMMHLGISHIGSPSVS